jgi:hypothetical protein
VQPTMLDRNRSIARLEYSRWLVPPAAPAIHLCLGQVYPFSVFKIPLTHLLRVNKSFLGECPRPGRRASGARN